MRHFLKYIVSLVIAGQLLLAVPAMAFAPDSHASSGTHCDEMATSATHEKGCPCCPDGGGSMSDCLTLCSLAAALTPSVFVVGVVTSHERPEIALAVSLTSPSDPPLKPPPIA